MKEVIRQFIQKKAPFCRDENGENYAYAVFRIVTSAMFFMHGAQKFFGLLGGAGGSGEAAAFGSLFWFAGLIEVVVGILVFVGVFTRLAAAIAVIEMLVAFFMVHYPKGIIPLLNGGEVAVLYFAIFLIIFRYGAGKLSLEKMYCKSELF
jgi:putative oxidoreductase